MLINYTTGYAGTGKSTELLKLVKGLNYNTSVVLCPTHKAIKRLSNDLPEHLECKTIHAILGWIPTINEQAKHIDHIDSTTKLDKELDNYTDIVIDEGGMMSEDMLMEITSKLEEQNDFETDHITIHIFLDPYQLLPVKGRQIDIDPDTTTNLTTQHRAESPDVVELFTKFVRFLEGTNATDLKIKPSENVVFTDNLKEFNPETDRLLAYTNACVGNFNYEIAKALNITSYENQWVQLGSKTDLIKVDRIINPSINDLLNSYENGTLYLQNSQINKKYLEFSLQTMLDCKDINFISVGSFIVPVIIGINTANLALKQAKEAAISNKSNFKWIYALGRAFTMDYSFASTVHKAQGSEFERVWIAQEDIKKAIMNGYYMNYARLMYVAISRAKKTVFIV